MSFIATTYFFFPDVTPPLSVEEESKLTEINVVNNGKRKMFNDCDHTCSKAVGFSCPGVLLHCSECESEKKLRTSVKKQCIDEVATVEAMKEVEKKLWLEHYNHLCEKLLEVLREKCTGCQTDESNQLGHELCLLTNAEEHVNLCFEEVYAWVSWEDVMNCWYKKVLEMPIVLNPVTLAVFRETLNPKDVTYKNRLKKWMIESPIVELWICIIFNFYASDWKYCNFRPENLNHFFIFLC